MFVPLLDDPSPPSLTHTQQPQPDNKYRPGSSRYVTAAVVTLALWYYSTSSPHVCDLCSLRACFALGSAGLCVGGPSHEVMFAQEVLHVRLLCEMIICEHVLVDGGQVELDF